jgi:hypothetical protein
VVLALSRPRRGRRFGALARAAALEDRGVALMVGPQRDEQGNTGTDRVSFTIDLTAPIVSFASPKDGGIALKSVRQRSLVAVTLEASSRGPSMRSALFAAFAAPLARAGSHAPCRIDHRACTRRPLHRGLGTTTVRGHSGTLAQPSALRAGKKPGPLQGRAA